MVKNTNLFLQCIFPRKGSAWSTYTRVHGLPAHSHGCTGATGGAFLVCWHWWHVFPLSCKSLLMQGHQTKLVLQVLSFWSSPGDLRETHLWACSTLWQDNYSIPSQKTFIMNTELIFTPPIGSQLIICGTFPAILHFLKYCGRGWVTWSPIMDVRCCNWSSSSVSMSKVVLPGTGYHDYCSG